MLLTTLWTETFTVLHHNINMEEMQKSTYTNYWVTLLANNKENKNSANGSRVSISVTEVTG